MQVAPKHLVMAAAIALSVTTIAANRGEAQAQSQSEPGFCIFCLDLRDFGGTLFCQGGELTGSRACETLCAYNCAYA